MIDQSAAYDLLDHRLLLAKLSMYNFGDSFTQWMGSYLAGRQETTKVQAWKSKPIPLGDCGAPQGSILAGLLHIISSNDCPAANDVGDSVLFVDDQTDIVVADTMEELAVKAQLQADTTCDWLKKNMMVVAPKKTKVMVVTTRELASRRGLDQPLGITVGGHNITNTQNEGLLGLTIDRHLTWTPHIVGELWRKKGENDPGLLYRLSRRATAVRRLAKTVTPNQLQTLISGLFNSVVQYCLPVYCSNWGPGQSGENSCKRVLCTKEDMRQIQVLQNKVLRCLVQRQEGLPWSELSRIGAAKLIARTGTLSVNQRAAPSTVTMLKRMLATGRPERLVGMLHPGSSRLGTLSVIRKSKHKLWLTSEGFIEKAVRTYNYLPVEIRNIHSYIDFKRQAKFWIKSSFPPKPP